MNILKSAYNTDFEEGKQYILKYKNRYFLSTVEDYGNYDNIVYFKTRLGGKDKYLKIIEEDPKPEVLPIYVVKENTIYQEDELTEDDLELYKLKPITLYNKATVPGYSIPTAPKLENYGKNRKKYIEDLFNFYNKTFFKNKIKLNKLEIGVNTLKKAAKQLGYDELYGVYNPYDNSLCVNPEAIKDEEVFKETLLHEMCHAMADSETSEILTYKDGFHQGHNHYWKKWMNRCGLKPEKIVPYRNMIKTNDEWKKYDDYLKDFEKTHKSVDNPNVGQFVIMPFVGGGSKGGIVIKEGGRKLLLDNQGKVIKIEERRDSESNRLFLMRKSDIKKFFKDMSFKKMKEVAGDELVEKGLNRMAASLFR